MAVQDTTSITPQRAYELNIISKREYEQQKDQPVLYEVPSEVVYGIGAREAAIARASKGSSAVIVTDSYGNVISMPAGWQPTGTEVMTSSGGVTMSPEPSAPAKPKANIIRVGYVANEFNTTGTWMSEPTTGTEVQTPTGGMTMTPEKKQYPVKIVNTAEGVKLPKSNIVIPSEKASGTMHYTAEHIMSEPTKIEYVTKRGETVGFGQTMNMDIAPVTEQKLTEIREGQRVQKRIDTEINAMKEPDIGDISFSYKIMKAYDPFFQKNYVGQSMKAFLDIPMSAIAVVEPLVELPKSTLASAAIFLTEPRLQGGFIESINPVDIAIKHPETIPAMLTYSLIPSAKGIFKALRKPTIKIPETFEVTKLKGTVTGRKSSVDMKMVRGKLVDIEKTVELKVAKTPKMEKSVLASRDIIPGTKTIIKPTLREIEIVNKKGDIFKVSRFDAESQLAVVRKEITTTKPPEPRELIDIINFGKKTERIMKIKSKEGVTQIRDIEDITIGVPYKIKSVGIVDGEMKIIKVAPKPGKGTNIIEALKESYAKRQGMDVEKVMNTMREPEVSTPGGSLKLKIKTKTAEKTGWDAGAETSLENIDIDEPILRVTKLEMPKQERAMFRPSLGLPTLTTVTKMAQQTKQSFQIKQATKLKEPTKLMNIQEPKMIRFTFNPNIVTEMPKQSTGQEQKLMPALKMTWKDTTPSEPETNVERTTTGFPSFPIPPLVSLGGGQRRSLFNTKWITNPMPKLLKIRMPKI